VVRTTAAEVRKRLIQYYYSPDHAGELVIELPLGSYVPSFRERAHHSTGSEGIQVTAEYVGSLPQHPKASEIPSADSKGKLARSAIYKWLLTAVALFFAVLLGFWIGRVRTPSPAARLSEPSNLGRFWAPLTATSSRITYCLAVATDSVDLQSRTVHEFPPRESGSLNVYDVITLARSIAPIVPKNGEFRVMASSDTGFAQLREGPFVLIGAFDNPWTMRITRDLPIGFEYDNHVREVVDRTISPKRIWTLQWQVPGKRLAHDYAIVARFHDKVTGEPVIILAGIFGGRNRSRKRGRLQSSVPGCSATEGSEELGPTESRGRHRSECDRRPPRTANGCCCGDVVRRFHTEKAVSYMPQNRAPFLPY